MRIERRDAGTRVFQVGRQDVQIDAVLVRAPPTPHDAPGAGERSTRTRKSSGPESPLPRRSLAGIDAAACEVREDACDDGIL